MNQKVDFCYILISFFVNLIPIYLERQSSSTISTPKNEFNTKRSQSINLKTPFTLKSTPVGNTTDENKRSGSAHHRSNKSSTTSKDPLCNLNAASCSPLNEHVRMQKLLFIYLFLSSIFSYLIKILKFINNLQYFVI
jgi:hypothetical protein